MLKIRRDGEVTDLVMARTFLGRPLYFCHAFLIGDVLVDSGARTVAGEFRCFLDGRRISTLVNTHHHEDHIGNNALVARRFGLVPQAHRDSLPYLVQPEPLPPYRLLCWGYPHPQAGRPLAGVVEGNRVRLRVIDTPGHCHGHVVLLDDERGLLFSGDLFMSERVQYLRCDEDVDGIISSLRRVLKHDFDRVYCALKGTVQDGKQALQRKLYILEEQRGRVEELAGRGWPEEEIARAVFGPEGMLTRLTGGQFSRRNFVRSITGKKDDLQ